jgi:branched-chain amino acid aminotransferase
MLNIEGDVAECTGDNIFIVKDGTIYTPHTDAGILHGVTRAFVISDIAPSLGYHVEERRVKLPEVLAADEVFLTGTAAEIIGVNRIGEIELSGGQVGAVTLAMNDAFRARVRADAPED